MNTYELSFHFTIGCSLQRRKRRRIYVKNVLEMKRHEYPMALHLGQQKHANLFQCIRTISDIKHCMEGRDLELNLLVKQMLCE